jgi:lipid II:glycine glycyltransferase (peptidoglycan interpeptide bridge formation enzyme)
MKVVAWSFRNIDKEVWGALENQASYLSVFQTYSWARVLNSIGIDSLFFVLIDDEDPLVGSLMFKSRFALDAFNGYEGRGGFLLSPKAEARHIVTVLYALKRKMEKERSLYAFVYPIPLLNLDRYFLECGYIPHPHATFIVDLKPSIEGLWERLDKRARWGIRKSLKAGIVVTEAKDWSDWEEYYNIYVGECHRLGVNPRSYELHKAIYHHLMPIQMASLLTAQLNSKIIAGSLFLATGDEIVYYKNASNPKYLQLQPNNVLQWQAIMLAKERGIRHYDLSGALWNPSRDSPLYGVHKFKEKWGGKLYKYNFFNLGRLYSVGKHLTEVNPRIRKFYHFMERCRIIRRFDRVAS